MLVAKCVADYDPQLSQDSEAWLQSYAELLFCLPPPSMPVTARRPRGRGTQGPAQQSLLLIAAAADECRMAGSTDWVGQSPCRRPPPFSLTLPPSLHLSISPAILLCSAVQSRYISCYHTVPSTTVNAKRKHRPKRVQTQGAERHRRHPCLGVRPGIPAFPSPVLLRCLPTTFSHSGNDSVVL